MIRMSSRNLVMVPLAQSGVGLKEKREDTASWLGLTDQTTLIRDFGQIASDSLLLDSDADPHLNHASDPGTSTLNLGDSAGFQMERSRGITDAMSMTDYAHAALEGYTPPGGGGSGDPDLSKHTVTSSVDLVVGEAVYVTGNDTVGKASADPGFIETSKVNVFALVLTGNTAGNNVEVISDGSITRADWTPVTGSAALIPGAQYFLSATAGQLTFIPPSTDTYVVTKVGRAVSSTKLDIEIGGVVHL